MKSIVFNPFSIDGDYCWLCAATSDDPHHLIPGKGNRDNSEQCGLVVRVCMTCHDAIHHNPDLTRNLRKVGQLAYMQDALRIAAMSGEDIAFDDLVQEFRDIFGKSYLYDEEKNV